MFKIDVEELEWGGQKLRLETGRVARQADGAVLATIGETTVLATAVAERSAKPGVDFFPLTVNYQEKTYAAGKIPGGYFKREGRPTERETLISRLIDRPIRPLFVEGFRNETQVIATVLSYDLENDTDIAAMVASSAALTLSGIPFMGPIGAARVGYIDGAYVLNPTVEQQKVSALDLVVAGTQDAVLMVESEAKELTEEIMLGAVMFGHRGFQPVIEAIIRMAERSARPPRDFTPPDTETLYNKVKAMAEAEVRKAYAIPRKEERHEAVAQAKDKVLAGLVVEGNPEAPTPAKVGEAFKHLEKDVVRNNILDTGLRIDGRDTKTVRQIVAEASVLPRTHGSALFTRGETQALVVTTLGTGEDEQYIDSLDGTTKGTFLLHYNFPPFSVGEVRRLVGTSRREIGHGNLAERSVNMVMPTPEDFPYSMRVVSEILESNGSSSMASVCGASLALLDAGCPLRSPVAGIAMGLIAEGGGFHILSDIHGSEDHNGDMDFKVAGTKNGVTALQMDIKVKGLTGELLRKALGQAREGRLHILGKMAEAISSHRPQVSKWAPVLILKQIPVDKIGYLIGPGGKIIKALQADYKVRIEVNDDGAVTIAGGPESDLEAAVAALAGRKVVAFCGIGRPDKFFDTVTAMGATLVEALPFPDHHVFTPDDVMLAVELAARAGAVPVTTEKDFVRLPDEARPMVTPVPVRLDFADEAAIAALLGALWTSEDTR